MVDEDDVAAILLEKALTDLLDACKRLADWRVGFLDFVQLVVAVCLSDRASGLTIDQIVFLCARRVRQDIVLSL